MCYRKSLGLLPTYLIVGIRFSPPIEPVLEAVAARFPEYVVPRRVPLNLALDGFLNLRVEKAIENGQKYALKWN